jgi:hypothetical protein
MADETRNNKSEGLGCAVLATAMLLFLCPAVLADTDGNDRRRGMGEKFFVGIGMFQVNFDTTASKNFPGGALNPRFDFEDVLGLNDEELEGRLHGYWRFAPKHRLTFGYMLLGRNSAETILADEFEWDDTTWAGRHGIRRTTRRLADERLLRRRRRVLDTGAVARRALHV